MDALARLSSNVTICCACSISVAAWLAPNGELPAVIWLRSRISAKAAVQWVFQWFHVSSLGGVTFPLPPAEGHVTAGNGMFAPRGDHCCIGNWYAGVGGKDLAFFLLACVDRKG